MKAIFLKQTSDNIESYDHGELPTRRFRIFDADTGSEVGGITFRYIVNDYLSKYRGHSGFTIDEPFRRQGYATAAGHKILEMAGQIGLTEFVLTCSPENTASERTILGLGLTYDYTVDVPDGSYLWQQGIKKVKRFSINLTGGTMSCKHE